MFLHDSLNIISFTYDVFVSTLVPFNYASILVPFSYTPGVSKLWDRSLGTVLGCVRGTVLINEGDGWHNETLLFLSLVCFTAARLNTPEFCQMCFVDWVNRLSQQTSGWPHSDSVTSNIDSGEWVQAHALWGRRDENSERRVHVRTFQVGRNRIFLHFFLSV